jgi:hypothetical protein
MIFEHYMMEQDRNCRFKKSGDQNYSFLAMIHI